MMENIALPAKSQEGLVHTWVTKRSRQWLPRGELLFSVSREVSIPGQIWAQALTVPFATFIPLLLSPPLHFCHWRQKSK